MKYFELTENIGDIEGISRALVGGLLIGIAMAHPVSMLHASILPMIAAYFVLTAIVRWDPVGYLIEVALKLLGHVPVAAPVGTLGNPRLLS